MKNQVPLPFPEPQWWLEMERNGDLAVEWRENLSDVVIFLFLSVENVYVLVLHALNDWKHYRAFCWASVDVKMEMKSKASTKLGCDR